MGVWRNFKAQAMPRLAVHMKLTSSERNKTGIILTYYQDADCIGTLERSTKHRGIYPTFVAVRDCSEEEYKAESHPWRYEFLRYDDWDILIEDEKKWTDDPQWFSQLEALKQKYPFKKQKSIEIPESWAEDTGLLNEIEVLRRKYPWFTNEQPFKFPQAKADQPKPGKSKTPNQLRLIFPDL